MRRFYISSLILRSTYWMKKKVKKEKKKKMNGNEILSNSKREQERKALKLLTFKWINGDEKESTRKRKIKEHYFTVKKKKKIK